MAFKIGRAQPTDRGQRLANLVMQLAREPRSPLLDLIRRRPICCSAARAAASRSAMDSISRAMRSNRPQLEGRQALRVLAREVLQAAFKLAQAAGPRPPSARWRSPLGANSVNKASIRDDSSTISTTSLLAGLGRMTRIASPRSMRRSAALAAPGDMRVQPTAGADGRSVPWCQGPRSPHPSGATRHARSGQ